MSTPCGNNKSAVANVIASLWYTKFCAYCVDAAPNIVTTAPDTGKLSTVANALAGVYKAGDTVTVVVEEPVAAAVTVNCCNEPVVSRVCGLTE